MPYEVISLDRDTASMPHAEIRKAILEMDEGQLFGDRIPMEIDDLERLGEALESCWGMKRPARSSALDVERHLDRFQVWGSGRVAVRRLGGARRDT
jgi:hypothetical protein